MSDNKTILFDLDGSLANYDKAMLNDMRKMLSPGDRQWIKENKTTLEKLYYENPPKWLEERRRVISTQVGWWKKLERINAGFQILTVAKQIGFDTQILTKASMKKPLAWMEKVEWCAENIKYDHNITITQTKGDVYGKVLYDDWPEYIEEWLNNRPRGLVIMPKRPIPSQKKLIDHPNVILWDGSVMMYPIVKNALEIAFKRPMGKPAIYKES